MKSKMLEYSLYSEMTVTEATESLLIGASDDGALRTPHDSSIC